jgi:hypothetical protein
MWKLIAKCWWITFCFHTGWETGLEFLWLCVGNPDVIHSEFYKVWEERRVQTKEYIIILPCSPLNVALSNKRRVFQIWVDGKWVYPLFWQSMPHYGPGVNSASNRNEYQEYFLQGEGGRCIGMTTLSWNLGAVTSWNPQGLSRPVMGLLFFFLWGWRYPT